MNIFSKDDVFQKIKKFIKEHPDGVIEVFGPTASGKTDLSIEIAQKFGPSEIVSVDSRQVFRGFSISAAKITEEEKQGIVHWGLDLVSPNEDFSVVEFQKYAFKKIKDIQNREHQVLLCGGTMLWLDAVSENYIFAHTKNKKSNAKGKPLWPFLKIGIHWDRSVLYDRCNRRSVWMFENGLIKEVKTMRSRYPNMTQSAMTNFGYSEVLSYLEGNMSYEEALQKNQKRNRNYAKRQLTWWRGRKDIYWVNGATL